MSESIAESLEGLGGYLECAVCSRRQDLKDERIGGYLGHGWPTCHGYTMTWITQNLIDQRSAEVVKENK